MCSSDLQSRRGAAVYLEQGEGVGDVVAGAALRGDADLVGADGRLLPRLLDPLVPIHGMGNLGTASLARKPRPRKRLWLVAVDGEIRRGGGLAEVVGVADIGGARRRKQRRIG